jgi:frizzled
MLFLICSSLFPWCSDEIARPVLACRNVCEKVKTDCALDPIIKYWPSFLDCGQLPQPEKQELCMTVSLLEQFEALRSTDVVDYSSFRCQKLC